MHLQRASPTNIAAVKSLVPVLQRWRNYEGAGDAARAGLKVGEGMQDGIESVCFIELDPIWGGWSCLANDGLQKF